MLLYKVGVLGTQVLHKEEDGFGPDLCIFDRAERRPRSDILLHSSKKAITRELERATFLVAVVLKAKVTATIAGTSLALPPTYS